MRLSFRQGIARYQTDISSTPTFLQRAFGGTGFIDLVVAPDPTIVVFAHRDANYIVEEPRTIRNAWGPFTGTQTVYLYWDISLQTGVLTRSSTLFPPMYSGTPPLTPAVDQHWFDTTETIMRVWNGTKWIEKIRCFAGYLSSGATIRPYTAGHSQAGITGQYEGGNIVLDVFNKPLRQADGSFVTSATSMLIINNASRRVKLEAEVLSGMALEPVPKFSLVQMRPGTNLVLARSSDPMSRIAGIVNEDLHINEVGYLIADGLVRNPLWNFPSSAVNRPIFCGLNGEVTITPPTQGVCQVAGFVYDTDSVYMDVKIPIILDDLSIPPPVIPPVPGTPIADFTASVTSGPAPLSVLFTSTALGSPTTWEWDFTNDGHIDATGPTATYVFATPGVYSVRHRVTNAFGWDDEVKTSLITVVLPPETGLTTNLGIQLGGPSQVLRNTTFNISINVSNDGYLAATSVQRILTIPKVKGEYIQVGNLPPGATVVNAGNITTVTMVPVPVIPSGLTYGPIFVSITAPSKSGDLVINARTESPEQDSTLGDNTASISIVVKP